MILQGTIRSYDENTRLTIIKRLEELVMKTSDSFGGKSEFEIVSGAGAVINNSAWASEVAKSASLIVGEENIITSAPISVGDDMSEFMKLAPGCYILIGAKKEGTGPHHSSKFDFDEECLGVALRVMFEATLNYLGS